MKILRFVFKKEFVTASVYKPIRSERLAAEAGYTHGMSMRLQVLVPEEEMADIQRLAMLESLTVGEWVRRTLRDARVKKSTSDPKVKLAAIRKAATYSLPTADIEQMLREIELGREE